MSLQYPLIGLVSILAPVALYWLVRVASRAYFHEKLNYHQQLINNLKPRGEPRT